MVVLFLIFWRASLLFSILQYQFTFPPTVYKDSLFSTSWTIFVVFLIIDILAGVAVVLIYISWLVILNILSYTFWPFVCLLWTNVYLDPLCIFKLNYLLFFIFSFAMQKLFSLMCLIYLFLFLLSVLLLLYPKNYCQD